MLTRLLLRGLASGLSGRRDRPRLTILLYHRVLETADPLRPDDPTASEFDAQMGAIASVFNVLSLTEAIEGLRRGVLPARSLCVTFDDGYADNYLTALPVLKRHGLTATFFIASGYLDGGRMWNDSIIESMRQAPAGELDLGRLGLPAPTIGDLASRRMAAAKVIQAIKHRSPDERDASVRELADVTGARLPDDLMMTSAQIAALHAAGMEIGGHTVSHPILAVVDDDRARREMADGREALSAMIRAPVKLFAYPNGRPGTDYDARHVRMARDLGFTGAFSTASGSADPFSDFFQIPRYMPWDRSRWRFVARVIENYRRPASALA